MVQSVARKAAPIAAQTARLCADAEHREEVLAEMQLQAQQWQDYLVDSLKYVDQEVGPITSHLLTKGMLAKQHKHT